MATTAKSKTPAPVYPYPTRTRTAYQRNLTLAAAIAWMNALEGQAVPGLPGYVYGPITNFELANERGVSDANIPAEYDLAVLVECYLA